MLSWSRDDFLKLSSGAKSSQRCWMVMRKTLFWNFCFFLPKRFSPYILKTSFGEKSNKANFRGKKRLLAVRHITYVSTPLLLEAMLVRLPRKAKAKKILNEPCESSRDDWREWPHGVSKQDSCGLEGSREVEHKALFVFHYDDYRIMWDKMQ